ncbi:MAG: c-type cytochrome biogenesis protein CcsB [Dehalococcoidales bacterium]|nr:c-type cytochrome biogenesis protein CcsB [Dehalococcoidales bacterium]
MDLFNLEGGFLTASLVSAVVTIVFTILAFISTRRRMIAVKDSKNSERAPLSESKSVLDKVSFVLTLVTLVLITVTIIIRIIETGRGPFANMYEFALAFSWGIVVMGMLFESRYKTAAVKNLGFIVSILLLIFATVQHVKAEPLMPALQQSVLLSLHVASAVVAYGILTIGFGSALIFIIQDRNNSIWLPDKSVLDTISYQAVIFGFPFLTLTIILGALWGDIAWGRYWGWDPKETASLVTWLVYAAYIHARVMRGWRGTKTAVLMVIGFAAIILTFFGNYIFTGLHAY